MKSPVYWHPAIYNLLVRFLLGKYFRKKYKIVAEEIGSLSMLDVCCGDCFLANYVDHNRYQGIDVNPTFITYGKKRGLRVSLVDISKDDWPQAECVVILGSLYQFIPGHERILNKAFHVAKKRVIVSEPIYNLADSGNPLIAWIARIATSPGIESSRMRFNRSSLMVLFEKYKPIKIIELGRELLGVFDVSNKRREL